jgi:hypothetical protein
LPDFGGLALRIGGFHNEGEGVGTTHSSPPTGGCRQLDEVVGRLSTELIDESALCAEASEMDKEESSELKLAAMTDSADFSEEM